MNIWEWVEEYEQKARAEADKAAEMIDLAVAYEPGNWQRALQAAEGVRLDVLQRGVTQREVDRALIEQHAARTNASLAANTRTPEANLGDIQAMIAALRTGRKRLAASVFAGQPAARERAESDVRDFALRAQRQQLGFVVPRQEGVIVLDRLRSASRERGR